MENSQSFSRDTDSTDRGVNRRTVLQGLGTGAVASVGLVGTASAHWVEGKPVFCGCSQLCVCVKGNADVLMARETDDGEFEVGFVVGPDELDPYPDGTPRYSGNFCVSTDDEDVPHGKIIGLQVAGTRWVNPNQCAQKALEAEQEQLDSTHSRPKGDAGGPCGKPPCEHPSNGKGDDDATDEIEVTWEYCETVSVTGSDEGLEEIIVHPMRCFADGPCPDGVPGGVTFEDPDLPLTIDDESLGYDDEELSYYIVGIELQGDVAQDSFGKPDDLDCGFETSNTETNIEFEMDDQTITLAPDEDPVSQVTVTGTAEFSYTGWEAAGPVGHAFITAWAQSDSIDTGGFTNSDAERYFDVDSDTDVVRNDVEITFDVPPEVGDPQSGEAIETEILGVGLFGLERGTDPDESENIGDWRENDPMTLRVERAEASDATGDIQVTWEDCETVSVTGSDEGLEEIVVHPMRCFAEGPCPDGVPGGVTFEDPELPLTIDDESLGYDDEEVSYYIVGIELQGDVAQDSFGKPNDLDCGFE